jgi:glycosyltransferase involved in cell wall biosynthesis
VCLHTILELRDLLEETSMKIGIIAHGSLPIPPTDWGGVEGTLWHRKQQLERMQHTVDLANTRDIYQVMHLANRGGYDFIHCHCESFILACLAHLKQPFAITSHWGGLYRFDPADARNGAVQYLFRDTLRAPAHFVLSDRIRGLYARSDYGGFLRVLRNPVEVDHFRLAPQGNGRAICVGEVSRRKRQTWLSTIARDRVPVDFVGPWPSGADGSLDHEMARYLGVWTKPMLYDRLTDYSCHVLLSESEAAPKVVLEALAAGLSLVISEACTANLTNEEFITVIPDGETRPEVIAHAIQTAIDRNAQWRPAIRQYARERFDHAVVTRDYLQLIDECRDHFASLRPAAALATHVL